MRNASRCTEMAACNLIKQKRRVKPLIFAFKFCGGCNPRYDRVNMLNEIKKHFDGKVQFEIAQENKEYDGLLIIGGCTNCCPEYKYILTKTDPVLVWDNTNYQVAVNKINDIVKEACSFE